MESSYHVFESKAKQVPAKTSLVYLGKEYTFAQLLDTIDRVASALSDLGVKKGDTAILFISNCPQWVVGWFALQKIGAVAVPITP